MKKNIFRKARKWLTAIILAPVILVLLVVVLLYLPPVQRFVVGRVADGLSESTGMKVTVGSVRLAFPLDLSVGDVTITDGRDTVVDARTLLLDVRLLPLFSGRADIDAFSLVDARVNTKDFIADTRVRGRIGRLEAQSHGVEWGTGRVRLDRATLRDADLYVALSDTAAEEPDTVPSMPWIIDVDRLDIASTSVSLSLPGDTMRVALRLGEASLTAGHFDTGRSLYTVGRVAVKDGGADYVTRAAASPLPERHVGNRAFALSDSITWPDFIPSAGIDPSCIRVSTLALQADSVYYDSLGTLRLNLSNLKLRERSGLRVTDGAVRVFMDSVRIRLDGLRLALPSTTLTGRADLPFNALTPGRPEQLSAYLAATIGPDDFKTLATGYAPDDILRAWPHRPLTLGAEIGGNADRLLITRLDASMPGLLSASLSGNVADLMADGLSADVAFTARLGQWGNVAPLLPADVRTSFAVPSGTTLRGTASVRPDRYSADATVAALGGTMHARAALVPSAERYDVSLTAQAFPAGSFLPGMGLGTFSGNLTAAGHGFDVLSPRSSVDIRGAIAHLDYGGNNFGGIKIDGRSSGGKVDAAFSSTNPLVLASGRLTATLADRIDARLTADIDALDMLALGLSDDTVSVGGSIDITAFTDRNMTTYGAAGGLTNIHFMTPRRGIPAKDLLFDFATSPDTTTATATAGDLALALGSKGEITRLSTQFAGTADLLMKQLRQKRLNLDELKRTFPVVDLDLRAGRDNPLSKILYIKGIRYNSLDLCLTTNPRDGLGGHLDIGALREGSLLLDTVNVVLRQDTAGIFLDGIVHNYTKDNPNKFRVDLGAFFRPGNVGARLQFHDAKNRKGVDLGLHADLSEQGINLSLTPLNPVIAYRNFTVNDSNYIFLGRQKEIRADVKLLADDGTGLHLYSMPGDSVNDITVSVNRLNLGELSTVLPYLPAVTGFIDGDLRIVDDHRAENFSVAAQMVASDFTYEGAALGNVGIEAFYMPQDNDRHYANAYISTDGTEVLQCEGTYDNNAGTFDGTASLHDCPLRLLNGFLAGTDVALRGNAAGDLRITGTADAPVIDGALTMDSAHLYSDVYGFDFLMDPQPVQIDKGRLVLTDYALRSSKDNNPLTLNGTLDMSNLDAIALDFTMRANNFCLVDAEKTRASLVFGKVYANYIGTLRGTSDNIAIRGKLEILDRTDMTYVLKDTPLTIDQQMSDLVKFVSFTDTATVVEDDPLEVGGFDLTLGISISDAARFRCNLSEDGENYVDLEGGGDLTMRITDQGDMRLTGRFTANDGKMKYSLPVIPLKTFNIEQGSYVDFTGDMLNPTLAITAKERVRATVTENDRPRTVSFDVGVDITQTLENMGLSFIIEAPEDLSVQNQLTSMSAEERSKTAVAMLATGMYVTDDLLSAGGSGLKASNALNAFLQNEIQNIAGSALKTIDLSVGMESGTSSTGTETTDYSFQFSKRLWNNRISIVIGGKVSTGEDAHNSAESFIDNIAVEYRLDKSATRYVKVFYDRSTQDPLEGQLTQTGAGLVLRRKTNKLGELFLFSNKKRKKAETAQ